MIGERVENLAGQVDALRAEVAALRAECQVTAEETRHHSHTNVGIDSTGVPRSVVVIHSSEVQVGSS